MFFYRVSSGDEGKQCLEKVRFQEFSTQVLAEINAVVHGFTRHEDDAVFERIAAGRAAALVFDNKAYRSSGLTKAGFCERVFGRAPKTIDTYVAAAASYEDIGGLDCPVQPDSVNQLETLQKIRPEARHRTWMRSAELNSCKAPSGVLLLEQAAAEKVIIPAKKSKPKPASPKVTLPCSTLLEAVDFAAAHQEIADTEGAMAWSRMREFLQSLAHQGAKGAPSNTRRKAKPRRIPDAKGQTLMFKEVLKPISHEITEQPELPQFA